MVHANYRQSKLHIALHGNAFLYGYACMVLKELHNIAVPHVFVNYMVNTL